MQYSESSDSPTPTKRIDETKTSQSDQVATASTRLVTWLVRIAIGIVFIFSGFAKAVDPWGGLYKMQDYFNSWNMTVSHEGLLMLACLLAMFEFCLGVAVISGVLRRVTAWLTLLFMTAMTVLTLYIWIADPVADCGCFGEALIISNSTTFWKNVALLMLAAVLVRYNSRVGGLIRPGLQWLWLIVTVTYVVVIEFYGYNIQPLVDFRPYPVGTDMAALVDDEDAGDNIQFVYERDGERRTFAADSLPDDSWTFVERVTAPTDRASIAVFDGDDEVTADVFDDTPYRLLLLVSDPKRYGISRSEMANRLYDYARSHDIEMQAIVAVTPDSVDVWRERTQARYDVNMAEDTDIKMLARGDAAIVALRGGKIVWKTNIYALPSDFPDADDEPQNIFKDNHSNPRAKITLIYLLALLAIYLMSRYAQFIGSFKRHKNQDKQLNETSKTQPNNYTKSMRKNIVAGNWKMNTTVPEGLELAAQVNEALATTNVNCDVIICVPFTHLALINQAINTDRLGLGAENCADHASGAYTGEVSAAMVASTGAKYVILGHSERRQYYGEDGAILRSKVALALENGLTPIFCIGEVLEEREAGRQNDVVRTQMEEGLFNLSADDFSKIIVAYEPVWAIGTGKTATADQAEEIHAYIRGIIAEKYGKEVAENTSILYGGSCKPGNAAELFAKPDVDGGLIGGASLKCEDFMGIVRAF